MLSFFAALGWASLALAVISLPSLLALALVPLVPPSHLQTLLCPMVALAIGTLCGDALLHLLPHVGLDLTPSPSSGDSVLKGASVLAGLYLFFLVEGTLGLQRHFKRKVRQDSPSAEGGGEPETELVTLQGSTMIEAAPSSECLSVAEQGHGHSHGTPGPGAFWDGKPGVDGGVAFSQGLAGGLSTTVAVFCHELPHELGDLALLLGAGWPMRRLLAFSGVSAALGFLGLLAGTILGHHFAMLSPWILALTTGVFLYVALVDMMPEMLRGDPGPHATPDPLLPAEPGPVGRGRHHALHRPF
ncbi:hypothetical protein SKAU_G00100950 [Synaphobranchus kaupii]|uniref:Uncharacterized protein n=1 Tax=Synaphobranchus kaupii TaxID=118154 RepID=A0A9Q1J6D3_SYNKA|nr:hypothetical protein SKAU_G00100950 [Synaphobranchus kaupii]